MNIYQFKITLEYGTEIWRTIDIRGDQTLDNLHEAIQIAFNWDNDHLYSFFLSGRYWDKKTEYVSEWNINNTGINMQSGLKPQNTDKTTISSLGLTQGATISYIFDYGDSWKHKIKLINIIEQKTGARYPRTVERYGEAPKQYPDYNEEEDAVPELSDEEILTKLGNFASLAVKVKETIRVSNGKNLSCNALKKQYAVAMELHEAIRKKPELWELFNLYTSFMAVEWVIQMPRNLAQLKLVNEALSMGLSWSDITNPAIFLTDRAAILVKAGMTEQARDQIKSNLERFSENDFVQLMAGDALGALKDYAAAEQQYRHCLKLADDQDYYVSVQKQLIPMLKMVGKTVEAETLEEEHRENSNELMSPFMPAKPIVRKTPKVGRNDPCPCGSGKKYKKCCFGQS